MKIKEFLWGGYSMLLIALSLVGCSDYDNGFTEKQLQFIQGFKDVFGEIDHTQDWNLAEWGTVTVTTSKPSRIKIYAKNFGSYRLVGDYEDVSGTQTLNFDMIEGTTNIFVSNGQVAQKAKVGDAVTFAGTRYTYTGDESGQVEIDGKMEDIVQVEEDFTRFPFEYVKAVLDELPENGNNSDAVTNNFSYISDGPFVMYPLYANTSSSHILGIYWQDSEGHINTQHVYRTSIGETGAGGGGDEYIPNFTYDGIFLTGGYCDSKGVIINLPVGTQFGFYLEVYDPYPSSFCHCLYSEAELNSTMRGDCFNGRKATRGDLILKNGTNPNGDPVFGATFSKDIDDPNLKKTITAEFLCFEDWDTEPGPDFNDLVFTFTGAVPIIVDDNAQSWVLSCEDLGGTFDLDYNDVVLHVEHTNGHSTATVTPLAAGGTLASYVYYNDGSENGLQSLGEIHSHFGQGETESGKYTPVNVKSSVPEMTVKGQKINVSKDWHLSSFEKKSNSEMAGAMTNVDDLDNKTMGGFFIVVLPEGDKGEPDLKQNNLKYSIIQNRPERGTDAEYNVPYIICTPSTWKRPLSDGKSLTGDYRWPQEHIAMYEEEGFTGGAYHNADNLKYSFYSWIKGDEEHLETSRYWYAFPHTTDDNKTFPNTCAKNTPRVVTTDTDSDDDGLNYDDIVPLDPSLHIVAEEGKEGFYVDEDGNIQIDLSKGDIIYKKDEQGNDIEEIDKYSYSIFIVSKSGVTPTISPTSGESWSLRTYYGVSTADSYYTNYKGFKNGYHTWEMAFEYSVDKSFLDEITISQAESIQYGDDVITFKISNIKGDIYEIEDLEDKNAKDKDGKVTMWGNKYPGYFIPSDRFEGVKSITIKYSSQPNVFYVTNQISFYNSREETLVMSYDDFPVNYNGITFESILNNGLYILFQGNNPENDYKNINIYIEIEK